MNKRTIAWLIPAAFLFAAGFFLSGFYDLPLNMAVYRPGNLFACLMEALGWLPTFLPTLFLAMLLSAKGLAAKQYGRFTLGLLVVLLGTAVLYYQVYHYLQQRALTAGPADWRSWLWLAAGTLPFLAGLWATFHLPAPLRPRLTFFAISGSVFMVANQVLITLMKTLWQRTRFDDMLAMGNFDNFTPWYLPFGHGGSSFPSGHTANAAGIFVLILLCDLFPAFNKHRRLLYGLCWVYIAAMAAARIVIGRHFLSDTLAAAGLIALLFAALRHTKPYRRILLRMRAQTGIAPLEKESSDAV